MTALCIIYNGCFRLFRYFLESSSSAKWHRREQGNYSCRSIAWMMWALFSGRSLTINCTSLPLCTIPAEVYNIKMEGTKIQWFSQEETQMWCLLIRWRSQEVTQSVGDSAQEIWLWLREVRMSILSNAERGAVYYPRAFLCVCFATLSVYPPGPELSGRAKHWPSKKCA